MSRIKSIIAKNTFFILLSLANLLLITYVYRDFRLTFYQQDEWVSLGYVLSYPLFGLTDDYSLIEILSGKGRYLARPFQSIFFGLFPYKIMPFVIFGLLLHSINTALVFLLTKKISKNTYISIIAGIFFAVASVGNQAVTWAAASPTTLPAATLVFLAVIFYLKHIENHKTKFLYLSQILLVISLYFKESGLFLFLFLPFLYLLYNKKKSFSKFIKRHLAFFSFGVFYILFNVLEIFTSTKTGFYITGESNTDGKIILHLLLYPITSLSQIFIPDTFVYRLTRSIVGIQYPRLEQVVNGPIYESIVADGIFLYFSFLMIIIILLLTFLKPENLRKAFISALVFVLLSFTPYLLLFRPNSLLESRYYYIGIAGGGMLLGLACWQTKELLNKFSLLKNIGKFIIIIFLVIYSFLQINIIHENLAYKAEVGGKRKKIVEQIKVLRPSLPPKPIFYITSDRDFITKNYKLPFQQGIGYTLMVLYYNTGVVPDEFIRKMYLWGMLDQGYKEVGEKGFGYFWDKERLKEEFKKNKKLNIDQLIGFYYDADKEMMRDTTEEIINFVENENK